MQFGHIQVIMLYMCISGEISLSPACHYKSTGLVTYIKHKSTIFSLGGGHKCGNQVCYLGALASGSSTTYHAYPYYVAITYTPRQTRMSACTMCSSTPMCKLTTYKLSSCTCLISWEVSSSWACHYKSISLVR